MKKDEVRKAIGKVLKRADKERKSAVEIRDSFGECGAFTASHWTAYGIEEAMEWLSHYLLKEEVTYRNGKRK